eukprot:3694682-Prorocentrum_lima.AAC.1
MVRKRPFKTTACFIHRWRNRSCVAPPSASGTRVELHVHDLWVLVLALQQVEVSNCCLGSWAFGIDPAQ